VKRWAEADPLRRLETYLRSRGALGDDEIKAFQAEGEAYVADVRTRMNADVTVDPLELFDHVFAEPTPQLREQKAQLAAELAEEY
jgi:2-oxoisovalerate dehydrogenase E1 component alpha subunit